MTTKPKAKKYRIRRSGSLSSNQGQPQEGAPAESLAQSGEVSSARQVSTEQQIDDIRKEGLTGRQLRMARRVAQKHGMAPTSDFDAIRLLRAKGIDPFQRSNMLELVTGKEGVPVDPNVQLPQTTQRGNALPSTHVLPERSREEEIARIQKEIGARRRKRVALLFSRLLFFVMLPTLMVGYYYYNIATPMYSTSTTFVIQTSSGPGGGAGAGKMAGLLAGTGLASSQDSIVVQSYLESRQALDRLDADIGFTSHFSQDHIDPIQRLDADASNEAAYRLYKKQVLIAYDPSEGIVKMEVIAADPETTLAFSTALLRYAEDRVDQLTSRLRSNQLRGASDNFDRAEAEMLDAQHKLVALQKKLDVLDPGTKFAEISAMIAELRILQIADRLTLAELQSNARPNRAKVDPLKRRLQNRQVIIDEENAKLTQGTDGGSSVVDDSAQLILAQTNFETRTLMMQSALQQLDGARLEANRQTRFLSAGVEPVAPDEARYPRKFENTILAFLIFSGIYLMLSLTASILREQVSS